jgi:hypothetical protein
MIQRSRAIQPTIASTPVTIATISQPVSLTGSLLLPVESTDAIVPHAASAVELRSAPGASTLTRLGPFPSHPVGAKAKDVTENALHAEVCHGTLTLREAQFIIATDWFRYYREKVLPDTVDPHGPKGK